MRRILRISGWIGCGMSAILLLATVVFWVRSLGHKEMWRFDRFEPNPEWNNGPLMGWGTSRGWSVRAIHGRLWIGSGTAAPQLKFRPRAEHHRKAISADEARRQFERTFQPGEVPSGDGVRWAWRFAGAGFYHVRDAVHPDTGRPHSEGCTLALPFWMPATLFGLGPGIVLTRRLLRRRKRFAAGLCQQCGYDLRATPKRCPECGTAARPG